MKSSKKIVIISLIAGCSCFANAKVVPDETPVSSNTNDFIITSTEGGFAFKPESGHGTFLFRNKQKLVALSELKTIEPIIMDENWVRICFSDEDVSAAVVTDIVNVPNESSLAIFPDDRYARVNVWALSKDNPDKAVLASRTRKEMLRAYSFLMGISGGGMKGRIMDVMTSMRRLDAAVEEIPGELVMRNEKYLERSGVKPYSRSTYRDACQEGWAPKPANPDQQKIWDEVHTIPSKPITIKYQKPTNK